MTSMGLLIWSIRMLRMLFSIPTHQKQREEAGRIYDKRHFTGEDKAQEQIEDYFKKIKSFQLQLFAEYMIIGVLIMGVSYITGELSFLNILVLLVGFSGGFAMLVFMLISSGTMKREILTGLDLNRLLDE